MTPTIPLTYVTRTLAAGLRATLSLSVWSPLERVYWALTCEDSNAALYRITDALTLVTTGRQPLGLPAGVPLALFADAEGAVHLVTTAPNQPASVLRLVDGRFVATAINFPATAIDAFAADPSGTLYHVEHDTGRIHALRAGTHTELATLDPVHGKTIKAVQAVWDTARQALVIIVLGSEGPFTQILKDGAVQVVPGIPGVGRYESYLAGMHLVREPRSGRAMLLRRPGEGLWSGTPPSAVHVLADTAWALLACDPAPAAVGYASGDGELFALAVGRVPHAMQQRYISNYAVRREFARFDGEHWQLHGRVLPICHALVMGPAGPVAFLGGETIADVVDDQLVPRPPIDCLRILVATPSGLLALGPETAPQPSNNPAIVWHPGLGAVLAIGGRDPHDKETQTTQVFTDGAWTELKTKARPHKQYAGLAVHDPARDVVVLAGGYSNKKGFIQRTSEFDGKAWTSFDAALPWASVPHAKLLAHDPTSGHVFALVAPDTGWEHTDLRLGLDVFRYLGAGAWQPAGELRFESPGSHGFLLSIGGFAATYDPARRIVVCAGPVDDGSGTGGVLHAALGPLLDSWPAHDTTTPPTPKQKPPTIPHRALLVREGGVGKFWIADLSEETWTARWGKRGTDGQSKTHTFATAEKADHDFNKKVREKLDGGYVDAPTGEDPSVLAGRTGWPMKLGKFKNGDDHIHGAPAISAWPSCRTCTKPLTHLALLHRHDERLPLRHAAVAVFQCEQTACAPWDPNAGGNKALLLADPVGTTPQADARGITYPKPKFDLDPNKEETDETPHPGSKLGGLPAWVQDDETPTCDTCDRPMQFVAQLAADDVGMNFGDVGVGYVFVCADEHQAKFLSQSA